MKPTRREQRVLDAWDDVVPGFEVSTETALSVTADIAKVDYSEVVATIRKFRSKK